MPSTNASRGSKAPPCSGTPSKVKSIHETVIYPPITVTSDINPCLDKSLSFEHVLACGHLILTAKPNEPCAANCHQASATSPRSAAKKKCSVDTTKNKKLSFYCDACIETSFEAVIPQDATAKQAEDLRADMRNKEAKKLGKHLHYRKCYIGLKLTTLPCRDDGAVSSKYTPRKKRHPFDNAVPQVGDNFFEDMLENVNGVDPKNVEASGIDKRKRIEEATTPQQQKKKKRRRIIVDESDEDYEEC